MIFALANWRWFAGAAFALAILAGAWWLHHDGYKAGAAHERAAWQALEVKAAAAAATLARERQAAVDSADVTSARNGAAVAAVAGKGKHDGARYYAANPGANRDCLTPERLRAIGESDRASYAAANATG